MPDLVGRLVENLRLQTGTHLFEDRVDKIGHADLGFIGEVVGGSPYFAILDQALRQKHVCCDSIFNVKVIAHVFAVRADDGALTPKHGTNGSGDYAIPIQVAAAVEISASRDA